MERIRGSAIGARVGGGFLGGLFCLASIVGAWGASNLWLLAPILVVFGFLIVRPWFLGVDVGEAEVRIRSWFRVYRIRAGEVVAVNLVNYTGFVGFALGHIPFIGRVAMLELETSDGRYRWFPATFNRSNRVLRIARRVRKALNLPPG